MKYRTQRLFAAILVLLMALFLLSPLMVQADAPEAVIPITEIAETEPSTPRAVITCDEPTHIAMYFSEHDVILFAKMLYGEGGSLPTLEMACIAWVPLNRYDASYGTLEQIITARWQFAGYRASNPVTDRCYWVALDVLTRWNAEKNGQTDVGRVLPADYLWFTGNGLHNYFRNTYKATGRYWDYSLLSPYES